MPNESVLLQVKNSLRAVNDRFEDSDDVPPPVRVIVAEGDEDVTIKVIPSDIPKHTSSHTVTSAACSATLCSYILHRRSQAGRHLAVPVFICTCSACLQTITP